MSCHFFQVKLINMISRVSVEQTEVAWTCTVQKMNNNWVKIAWNSRVICSQCLHEDMEGLGL